MQAEDQKRAWVRTVFDAVADNYDLMNDVMSLGLHRWWKTYMVKMADIQLGQNILDVASGTGDIVSKIARKIGSSGMMVQTDINEEMLRRGRDRLINEGILVPSVLCDAEYLPFADGIFDKVFIAFGLRNVSNKPAAIQEMYRVLASHGRLYVLEFSKVIPPLKASYDKYLDFVLPWLGDKVAHNRASYEYLASSIHQHPDQQTLKAMILEGGFSQVDYHNLSGGIVALHIGYKS
ncbi:MAG: class I SAM-dependent methyltransferase [Gammaproteobacteria bacterium]|nr:class I SAM-dependent methyltransferase [Gammaproteobacteria bacterium]